MRAKCIDCNKYIEADAELCSSGRFTEVECFCPYGYDDDCPNDTSEPQSNEKDKP